MSVAVDLIAIGDLSTSCRLGWLFGLEHNEQIAKPRFCHGLEASRFATSEARLTQIRKQEA
jgi:hypothetical protein